MLIHENVKSQILYYFLIYSIDQSVRCRGTIQANLCTTNQPLPFQRFSL